jgi:hypothetical protein
MRDALAYPFAAMALIVCARVAMRCRHPLRLARPDVASMSAERTAITG